MMEPEKPKANKRHRRTTSGQGDEPIKRGPYRNAVSQAAVNSYLGGARLPDFIPLISTARRAKRERQYRRGEGAELQELRLGPTKGRSVFADEVAFRDAWARHGARLMASLPPGRRPWAWYLINGVIYPGYDRERATLYLEGDLTELEEEKLLAYWRQEFDRANTDTAAFPHVRRAHYAWADIPLELAVTWTRERRRSAAQIRTLEAASMVEGPPTGDTL